MSKIKVGIIGVGSCAKSLVEGVQYYNENPDDKVGLMYPEIGGYTTCLLYTSPSPRDS